MKIRGFFRSVALGIALLTPSASALAATVSTYCYVDEVRIFANRVHVHCQFTGDSNVVYFAVPTSSSAEASRFTDMGLMAWHSAQPLFVEYDPFGNASSFQCGYNDCRRAVSSWMSVKF